MMDPVYRLAAPLLLRADPEDSHTLAVRALKAGAGRLWSCRADTYDNLKTRVFGLDFPNPLGLAAGFDKNAEVPGAMLGIGFGFVEVGTVTPLPQAGNPRPRLFRLAEDRAVINRMGFNNKGAAMVAANLRRRPGGIVGVNIGANKETRNRIADYAAAFDTLHSYADYIVMNVSSPNTPGLRGLQDRGPLKDLLDTLAARRAGAARALPLLLKIAPDLDDQALEDIVEVAVEMGLDGLIVSNTTLARPSGLKSIHKGEAGGLSGAPLLDPSTDVLRKVYWLTGGRLPLIGAGGVSSAQDALEKILAGASLVQLYSALVYEGPGLVARMLAGLQALVSEAGFASVSEAVGAGEASAKI